jgi:phage-related protein
MESVRIIWRSAEFDDYYYNLPDRVRVKYDYALQILETQRVVSERFVKKMTDTALYEVRISVGNNEYRTLIFTVDNRSFILSSKVLLLNSFMKKDKRQYKKEIEKAMHILKKMMR